MNDTHRKVYFLNHTPLLAVTEIDCDLSVDIEIYAAADEDADTEELIEVSKIIDPSLRREVEKRVKADIRAEAFETLCETFDGPAAEYHHHAAAIDSAFPASFR